MDKNDCEVEPVEGLLLESISDIYRREKSRAFCLLCPSTISTINGCTSGLHTHANNIHKRFAKKRPAPLPKNKPTKKQDINSIEILKNQFPLESRLAFLTAVDGLSFNQIKTSNVLREGLQDSLNKLKSKTVLPLSDKTIREKVMKFGERVKELTKLKLKQLIKEDAYFSVDFDEYTSIAGRRYINVSVFDKSGHFWNLGLVRIIGKADALTVLKLVTERLAEFGIDPDKHVVSFVTDGAKVMEKLHKHSNTETQLCLVHAIHLAVLDVLYDKPARKSTKRKSELEDGSSNEHDDENTDDEDELMEVETEGNVNDTNYLETADELSEDEAVKNDPELTSSFKIEQTGTTLTIRYNCIKTVIDKIRKLAVHFKRSATDNDKLQELIKEKRKTTQGLKLKQDVKTRWSSLYEMLERYDQVKEAVDEAVKAQSVGIKVSHNDKTIVRCIIRALKPIAATVKVLCRRDSNLLTARTALKMLFQQLEKQKNPLTDALAKQLRIRIKKRWTINSSALFYLQTGRLEDTYDIDDFEDSEEEDDEELTPFYDHFFSELRLEDPGNSEELQTADVFKLHKKHEIKEHLAKIITRLCPNSTLKKTQNPEPTTDSAEGPPIKTRRSFEERLNVAVSSLEVPTRGKSGNSKQSELSKNLTAEMNFNEKNQQRGYFLQKCYDILITIKPTSVESERAFSSVGALCTKIKSRFNDTTLNILSFLRITLRNPELSLL